MDKFHNFNNFSSSSKNSFNEKNIDADSYIISQQDTFIVSNDHQFYSKLPKWMIPKSGCVHPLYEQIWQYVKSDKRDGTCETNLVSQLLMTSGLPVDVLGGLWSMANIGVEGLLSQQELYIILALITLVQNGYSVSNVSLLQHIHKPIIPRLNYALIERKYISTGKSNIEHKPQIVNKTNIILEQNIYVKKFQQPNLNMNISEDYDPLAVTFIEPKNQISKIIPSLTTNPEPKSLDLTPVNDNFEAFDDEFSDFQYAQFTISDESKKDQEFTDFQSAFDTLSFKENTSNCKSIEDDVDLLNVSPIDITLNLCETQENLISCKDDIHDKYEVFRTLAAESIDIEHLTTVNNHNDLNVKSIESIEENIQNSNVDDEFGDFLCIEEVLSNKPEIDVEEKNIQVQCINKCLEYLHEGAYTFSSISDERVLMEVINHDKGLKYLTQLYLISQICKRLLKNCDCPLQKDNLNNVMSKLEIYLNNMSQESIIISKDLESTEETLPCYLCKCDCSTDSIEYMLNQYHSSCINLLIHFVKIS